MSRLRSLRGRIALAFALAAMGAAVLYAATAIGSFLLQEHAEAARLPAERRAEEEAENRALVLALAGGMALAAPLVGAAAAALGWWLSGRALAPLREAADRAAAARSGARELLLPVRGLDDEWDRLAVVVNGLLDEQRGATDRARAFSANAAHELRTPLAALLGHVQVALRRERSSEEYREVLALAESEAARLAALVDALLTLARADSGELRAREETFDLGAVAADAVRRAPAPAGAIALEATPTPARGDPLLARRILENLVENALRHGASPVEVRAWSAHGLALASVTDPGPGVPPAVRARLFERFSREPGAGEGFGLGLAIARALAIAQGGRLRLDDSAPATRFVLELPGAGGRRP